MKLADATLKEPVTRTVNGKELRIYVRKAGHCIVIDEQGRDAWSNRSLVNEPVRARLKSALEAYRRRFAPEISDAAIASMVKNIK